MLDPTELVMKARKITLDAESAEIVDEAMRARPDDEPEDVVRRALRTWRDAELRLSDLKAAIRQGVESGPGIPAEDVFEELDRRYRGMMSGTD